LTLLLLQQLILLLKQSNFRSLLITSCKKVLPNNIGEDFLFRDVLPITLLFIDFGTNIALLGYTLLNQVLE